MKKKNQKKNKIKNLIPVIFISLVVGMILGTLLVGIYASRKLEGMKRKLSENSKAKKTVPKNPVFQEAVVPPKRLSVNGTVESVSKNAVSVKASSCQGGKIFTGKITDQTKIVRRERTSDAPYYKDVEVKLSEIEKDTRLSIEAFEDIADKTEFDAKKMIIEPVVASHDLPPPAVTNPIPGAKSQ